MTGLHIRDEQSFLVIHQPAGITVTRRVGGAQGPGATWLGLQCPEGEKLGLFIPQADLGEGTGDQLSGGGGDGLERGLQVQASTDAAGKLVEDR